MHNANFEQILANHCSPVLMGTKLSNLISVSKEGLDVNEIINRYNASFKSYGIVFEKVCECKERFLLFVYNTERLERHLKKDRIASFLKDYGYEESQLRYSIDKLKQKLMHHEFPHEIGVFLGFPLDDVKGFIENQGQNYIYCGYWKVYNNIEGRMRNFDLYDRLRSFVKSKLDDGLTLESIMQDVYKNTRGLNYLLKSA